VFDEEVFPFSKVHSNADAQLHAEILPFPPTLRTSHDYDEIDANQANGANSGIEDVDVQAGVQAEELALSQDQDIAQSMASSITETMDPAPS
jgi:hypothetical protein